MPEISAWDISRAADEHACSGATSFRLNQTLQEMHVGIAVLT